MTTEKQPETIPSEATVTQIAGLVGVPMASVRDLLQSVGYPVNGKHSTTEGLRALFRAERERKGKKTPQEAVAAQQMALDAAAISAMDRGEREGALCPMDMVVQAWEDRIASASTAVSKLQNLTKAQKLCVFEAIRSVGVPSIKQSEQEN